MTRPAFRILSLVTLLGALPGADAADEEIASLERDYLEKRRAIVKPLVAAHTERLKSLQETFLRRGDQARALAVANELNRLAAQGAPARDISKEVTVRETAPESPPFSGAIILTKDKAELSGGANATENPVAISLRDKGAAVQWKLPKLRPGRYRLWLEYVCPPLNGGRYRVAFAGNPPLDLTSAPTGGGPVLQVDLGDHELAASPAAFRLEATELAPRAAVLMHLQTVRIQPLARRG